MVHKEACENRIPQKTNCYSYPYNYISGRDSIPTTMQGRDPTSWTYSGRL